MSPSLHIIIQNYAIALFQVASEHNLLEQTQTQLISFEKEILHNPTFNNFISLPSLTNEQKSESIKTILDQSQLENLTKNFLCSLISNNRLSLLSSILDVFEKIRCDHLNICEATVVSANIITETEKTGIVQLLENKFKKEVKLNTQCDKSILGGIVVKLNDRVIDASLHTSIRKILII